MSERNDKVTRLTKELAYKTGIAEAFVEFDGRCAYCEEDLLHTRPGYSSGCIDHLIPKSLLEGHPQLAECQENVVLSCSSCNSMKHTMGVLRNGEAPEEMLKHHREELIQRVRDGLGEKVAARRKEWDLVCEIIRGA